MDIQELEHLHAKVKAVLITSDAIFLEGLNKQNVITSKLDVNVYANIVTEYDRRIEDTLVNGLQKAYPEIGFITEEATDREQKEWNWIIDPIDGTFNFAHGVQTCGTSIALWHKNEPMYGVYSFPTFGERVHAIKGNGIFINDSKLPSSSARITPTPYVTLSCLARQEEIAKVCGLVTKTLAYPKTFGASVYHIYLATTHKADLTIIINNEIWDIANAELFASESGRFVEYPWGRPDVHNLTRGYDLSVILGEEELVKKMIKEITGAIEHGRHILHSSAS